MTQTPIKVLIVDLYSAANQGDAAILAGLLQSLKLEIPHSEFVVHTYFPDSLAPSPDYVLRHLLISQFIGNFSATSRALLIYLIIITCALFAGLGIDLSFLLPYRFREPFIDFQQADIIVGMGGGFYNDNYWVALPSRMCHLLVGKLLRKRVVISAHSVGPFKRRFAQLLARYTFNKIDAICVRDLASVQVLQSLKIPSNKIFKVADSAWLLHAVPRIDACRLLQAEKIRSLKPVVISVSARKWDYYQSVESANGHECYLNALTGALDLIMEKYDASIIYLSTCYEPDKKVAFSIKERLKLPDQFHIASREYSANELKGLYGLMNLHIGTRMHSVILALSAGTICVGISYEPKLNSLMNELGLQEYVLDLERIDTAAILAAVEKALASRAKITALLEREVLHLQQLAQENAKIIANLARN